MSFGHHQRAAPLLGEPLYHGVDGRGDLAVGCNVVGGEQHQSARECGPLELLHQERSLIHSIHHLGHGICPHFTLGRYRPGVSHLMGTHHYSSEQGCKPHRQSPHIIELFY